MRLDEEKVLLSSHDGATARQDRVAEALRSPRRWLVRLAVVALLTAPSCGPVQGQADPEWLRMWQEAQTHRPADLGPEGRIAPADEPGTPLVVDGRVVEPDGETPAPGVVVFAYQTDRDGIYFSDGRPGSPWRLQGWARTDADGRFTFRTIRPGPYPGRHVPAHIHFAVESPKHGRQWTDSLRFADDPLLVGEGEGRVRRRRTVRQHPPRAHRGRRRPRALHRPTQA